MKVKELIKILKTMPEEAEVFTELRQSKNDLSIDKAKYYEKLNSVCLIADWRDFEVDEDEVYWCEKEQEELARDNAMESMVDIAMGK